MLLAPAIEIRQADVSGHRRLWAKLCRAGHVVNRKLMQRLVKCGTSG